MAKAILVNVAELDACLEKMGEAMGEIGLMDAIRKPSCQFDKASGDALRGIQRTAMILTRDLSELTVALNAHIRMAELNERLEKVKAQSEKDGMTGNLSDIDKNH